MRGGKTFNIRIGGKVKQGAFFRESITSVKAWVPMSDGFGLEEHPLPCLACVA